MNNLLTLLFFILFAVPSYADTVCVDCLQHVASVSAIRQQQDTLISLDKMRGENGLVKDAVWIKQNATGEVEMIDLNARVAPTNLALDLLIQAEVPPYLKLNQILTTLDKLPFHKDSGLFYREYGTMGYHALQKDISAIDNLHLALALWTVGESFPFTKEGTIAKKLFDRMDFSCFADKNTGLLHGNLTHSDGKWTTDAYYFGSFGSEARSLYSLGYALGLLKNVNTKDFPAKALSALNVETTIWNDGEKDRKLLRTWDGGAFQLLLPNLLISEDELSPQLKTRFEAYGDYIISEGKRRGLPLPAAHSASTSGINLKDESNPQLDYIGKAGSVGLVSLKNDDLKDTKLKAQWDSIVTPHALFLAATTNPKKYEEILNSALNLKWNKTPLYLPGMGWMDAFAVSGKNSGEVIPAQLALDQGMIQLSLLKMASEDGKTLSARALRNNPKVFSRLKNFYEEVDKKLR